MPVVADDGAHWPTTKHLASVRLIFKMKGFNERKGEILRFIDRMGEGTALDIARALDITQVNSSRLLGHYYRQGLLERHMINKFGEQCYEVTDRGRERLNWIYKQFRTRKR